MKKHSFMLFILMLLFVFVAAGCKAQPTESSPTNVVEQPMPSATSEMPITGSSATPTEAEAVPATAAPTEAITTTPEPEKGEALEFSLIPGESRARYRVREQLVNLSLPNDAVGETDQITGSITILPDGSIDPDTSRFEVDLSTLVSDQSRRDNYLRNNVLQTNQYPMAVFVPKRAANLSWPLPASGELQFQLVGDLTIRDATREVIWEVTGMLQDGVGQGQAVTRFTFADFGLTQPRVPVVLSIEDEIVLEIDGSIRGSGLPDQ